MLRRTSSLCALALSVSLCVACGDDGGGGGGDIPLDQIGPAFAGALCPNFDMCLGPIADVALGGRDCNEFLSASVTDDAVTRWRRLIDSGTASYDPAAMRACVNDISSMGCAAFDNLNSVPCTEAFTGTIALGAPCQDDIECVGDAFCRRDAACPGTCAAKVGEGMPCVDDEQCQGGLTCGNAGECETPAGPGQPCEGGVAADCRTGLICRGADAAAMTAGVCTDLSALLTAALDEPCELEGALCQEGLFCTVTDIGSMGATTVCRAGATSGGACQLAFPDMCPAGEACDADPGGSGTLNGTCQPLPGDGQPCAGGEGSASCGAGLSCIDGTCGTFKRLGQACANGNECYSGTCTGGVCVEPPLCPAG